jgi:hypothetical protein
MPRLIKLAIVNYLLYIPYFIDYSTHFFTWKIMLKYSLHSAHHTWKVAEKGFKMTFMMNKLAMIINSCEIILEKYK